MNGRLLLNIVIIECSPVLELFPSEDHAHLVGVEAGLRLNFRLDVFDQVGGLYI